MEKLDDLKFYQDIYDYEINRKESINNKVTSYITLMTIYGAIFVYIIKNIYNNFAIHEIFQYELILLFIVILIINIYNMYNSNIMNAYEYLSNSKDLKDKFDEIENYYTIYYDYFKNEGETLNKLVNRKKEEKLIQKYVEITNKNAQVNDERIKKNLRFMKFYVISLIISGIIGIYITTIEKPINIKVCDYTIDRIINF